MIFNYKLLRSYFAESFEHFDSGGERNLLAKLTEGTLSDRNKQRTRQPHGQIEDCKLSIYLTEPAQNMCYQKSFNKLLGDDPNRLSLTILTLGYAKPHCRQSKSLAPNVKLIVKYIPSTNSEQLREKVDCLHLDMSWGTSKETQFVECRELCKSCLIHGMIVAQWLVERSRLWRKWIWRGKPLTR